MKDDFYYLVSIDPCSTMIRGQAGKYKSELTDFFGAHANSGERRFAMSKDQLSLFFYLRCRMGGNNGVKELDMRRQSGGVPSGVIDMRWQSTNIGPAPKPTNAVELAQQLATVDKLLNQIDRGEPLQVSNITLNPEHMKKVLEVQRAGLRAKIVAAVSVRT